MVVPNLLETALLQCARTFCFDRDLQDSQCESYFENISNLIYIYNDIWILSIYQEILRGILTKNKIDETKLDPNAEKNFKK